MKTIQRALTQKIIQGRLIILVHCIFRNDIYPPAMKFYFICYTPRGTKLSMKNNKG